MVERHRRTGRSRGVRHEESGADAGPVAVNSTFGASSKGVGIYGTDDTMVGKVDGAK